MESLREIDDSTASSARLSSARPRSHLRTARSPRGGTVVLLRVLRERRRLVDDICEAGATDERDHCHLLSCQLEQPTSCSSAAFSPLAPTQRLHSAMNSARWPSHSKSLVQHRRHGSAARRRADPGAQSAPSRPQLLSPASGPVRQRPAHVRSGRTGVVWMRADVTTACGDERYRERGQGTHGWALGAALLATVGATSSLRAGPLHRPDSPLPVRAALDADRYEVRPALPGFPSRMWGRAAQE